MRPIRILAVAIASAALLVGCGRAPDEAPPNTAPAEQSTQRYPDVVNVTAERDGDTYTFMVTISSPYDTPERYADGWRIKSADGVVYGEHTLGHDHANEQPFIRTQSGVSIPGDVRDVIVEGRDRQNGYGGATKTVPLP